jgi:hypothetical protein
MGSIARLVECLTLARVRGPHPKQEHENTQSGGSLLAGTLSATAPAEVPPLQKRLGRPRVHLVSALAFGLALCGFLTFILAVPGTGFVLRRIYRSRLRKIMAAHSESKTTRSSEPPWAAPFVFASARLEPSELLARAKKRRALRLAFWLGLVLVEGSVIGLVFVRSAFRGDPVAQWSPVILVLSSSWPGGLLLIGEWISSRASLATSGAWLVGITLGPFVGMPILVLGFALAPNQTNLGFWEVLAAVLVLVVAYLATRVLLLVLDKVHRLTRTSPSHLVFGLASTCWVVMMSATAGKGYAAIGWVMILVHLIALLFGMKALSLVCPNENPIMLLVLRPFTVPGARQVLLRRLARLWTELGPITMIAGPDLATATFDLSAVRALVAGTLKRLFFDGSRWPSNPRAEKPLRDLRYPLVQMRCFDDTWWPAFTFFARDSDAIVMDARGLRPGGVARELAHLVQTGLIDKTVLLSSQDADTTIRDLEKVIVNSVSRAIGDRVFQGAVRGAREADLLIEALLRGRGLGGTGDPTNGPKGEPSRGPVRGAPDPRDQVGRSGPDTVIRWRK